MIVSKGFGQFVIGATVALASAQLVSEQDALFIEQMARAGMVEIRAAQLALAKAHDAAVKSYAEAIVEDRSKAHAELERIAAARGVPLPAELRPEQRGAVEALAAESGVEFERAFLQRTSLEDHPAHQRLFQQVASEAEDDDVREFAEVQTAVVARHLELARSVGHSKGNIAPSDDDSDPREPRAGSER